MTERERLIELLAKFMVECRRPCQKLHSNKTCQECGTGQLTDYLLANGVIVPPCKVGDTVYKPIITDDTHEPAIWEIKISHIEIARGKFATKDYAIGTICEGPSGEAFDFDEIGKTVFLTKDEAEQALKGGAE